MNQYLEMLDLAPTATLAEIKSHYQLLMRIYNPERFTAPEDKSYAAQMRENLGKAYRTLLGPAWPTSELYADIFPRVEPSLIDWGIVKPGDRLAAQVRIYTASPPQRLLLTPNDAADWLVVGRGETLEVAGKEVAAFEVTANTRRLAAGKKYNGQITVTIDDVTQPVFLIMKIAPAFSSWSVNHRWLQRGAAHIRRYWVHHAQLHSG